MKPHLEQFLRRRRFFIVLPLLVLPFITMLFWALGGGKGLDARAQNAPQQGLNAALPDAQFEKREVWDKLSLYEFAERDSIKYRQARERDPYFELATVETRQDDLSVSTDSQKQDAMITTFPSKQKQQVDPNELRVNKKLEELYKEINRPSTSPKSQTNKEDVKHSMTQHDQFSSDVDRLEKMMEMMKESPETDPEMQQIENVLEKILDIQYPERVKERLKATTGYKETTLPVEIASTDDDVSLLDATPQLLPLPDSALIFKDFLAPQFSTNGFFGLEDEPMPGASNANAIEAIVHVTQEIVEGSTIKLRLLNEITVNGNRIPKDQFVYGTASIDGERLILEINSIRIGNSVLPVSLSAYDLDGLEGIYIPGAISRDAVKQASDNALQNIQLMSLDPSIGAQAVAAGVEATKGLFSKKAKLVKVKVKAGYHILLRDTNGSTI